mmetsp:Transcript_7144/g.10006  ORF Transcript_7144/g.10006 Transcript_7144/m.10006 type:complete len:81 (-) Transcript_7144:69-311(-)
MKFLVLLSVFMAMVSAFVPASQPLQRSKALRSDQGNKHVGTGGMNDTRDPDPVDDEDPRKSISAAPTFEEYLKLKQQENQ